MLSLRTASLATLVTLSFGCGSTSSNPSSNDGDQGVPSGTGTGSDDNSGSSGSSGSSASGTASSSPGSSTSNPSSIQGQLFGSHTQKYVSGTIFPSGGQAALDSATAAFYDQWKTKYLIADCGGYYVGTTLDGNSGGGQDDDSITVSEAHGYGMVIAAMMAGHDPQAQTIFDGLNAVFLAHPSILGSGLMAWEIDKGCKTDSGGDSATDGDLDIAFA